MQLLEIHILRYLNDPDLNNYLDDELQLLSEGEARINREHQTIQDIPIQQLIRHFFFKWEIVILRLRVAHPTLHNFFNSENFYNFEERPNSTREEITRTAEDRLCSLYLTQDICAITIQLIHNIPPSVLPDNFQQIRLDTAYSLFHEFRDQQE